jgi:diguanylate cyclase (GGDEF)-like protein
LSIRLKLSLLLIFLFAAALLNSIFVFLIEGQSEENLAWVNHTHEVLIETEQFLGAVKDAETGQRGYLLTENINYLEPFHQGVASAKENLSELKLLTTDNLEQQESLNNIENLMVFKFDELHETVELNQKGNRNEALEIVAMNEGKQHMDDLRFELANFVSEELILLEKRKGSVRESRASIHMLVLFEVLFFISLAVITQMFIQKNLFAPLSLLLKGTEKIESGEKLEVTDVVEKNELGHLLSTFYIMGQKVYQREKVLDHKARHDELTGLKNRETLFETLEEAIDGLDKTGGKIAVLYLDLNSFKEVNDTKGHDFGDLVLIEAANRLSSSVRSKDTVFRVGGDEFLIIARSINTIEDARYVVKNILDAFSEPTMIRGEQMNLSVSIGLSIAPNHSTNVDELIKLADVAMYSAKRGTDTDFKLFDKSLLRRESDNG